MKSRSGLTLVELVVAITIAGLIVVVGYSVLGELRVRRERLAQVATSALRMATMRATLRDAVAGAELTLEEDAVEFRGLDGESRDGQDDRLSFQTSADTPLGPPGTSVVLYVDRSPKSWAEGLVVDVRAPGGVGIRTLVLDRRARGLTIRYLSALSADAPWSESWVSRTLLPRAVELRVLPAAGDTLARLMRLPLIVPIASAGL